MRHIALFCFYSNSSLNFRIYISVKLIRGSNDLGIHRSTTPLQNNVGASQFILQVRCRCRFWHPHFLTISRFRRLRVLQTIAPLNLTILLLINHRCRRNLGQLSSPTTVKRLCSPSETPIELAKSWRCPPSVPVCTCLKRSSFSTVDRAPVVFHSLISASN